MADTVESASNQPRTAANLGTDTSAESRPARILVTGATGFVGRSIVRELVRRGYMPVCIVRDKSRFASLLRDLPNGACEVVAGDLFDDAALEQAAGGCAAAIHLVGIITESPLGGQTFGRIHIEATRRVMDVCKRAGIERYVHMSALGTRANAVSEYHKTKWTAECFVRDSDLAWTIFRPSMIHGPDGEFMRMLRVFVCDLFVSAFGIVPCAIPLIPYFGSGQARLQPVDVRDVAHCFVAALGMPETIGQTYDLGGTEALTWKSLYRVCKEIIPGAKQWKPIISLPLWKARLLARTAMKLPILPKMLRFDIGQVRMSQEDSVCDVRPVEETFGIQMRDFREELRQYAAEIP